MTGKVTKNGNQQMSKALRIRPKVRKAFFSRLRLCNFRLMINNSSLGNMGPVCWAEYGGR